MTQNYIAILFKIIRRKKICIFSQSFSFKHRINKSNTKVSAHYWIVCLISENVCFNVFIFHKFFNFFRKTFHSKAIEISNIIICHMQSNPMSSDIRVLIKIYCICCILYFLWIISRVNTIKSRFILIIFLYFKVF